MILIDGSKGEGGGQIVRTAIALSACTSIPFEIKNIRAKRKKPGIMRQHLTAIKAVAEICSAKVGNAEIGSENLTFVPGKIKSGDYSFSVGTAGSAMLVFQSVLPPLLMAQKPSRLILEGGTHNPWSPPYHFIERVFLPAIECLGFRFKAKLDCWGFFPAGGGKVELLIEPDNSNKSVFDLSSRGEFIKSEILAAVKNVSIEIAQDEARIVADRIKAEVAKSEAIEVPSPGPGNVAMAYLEYENTREMATGFGAFGLSRGKVASSIVRETNRFIRSKAVVGEHLADQLLVPLALFGGGTFCTLPLSDHFKTNAEIVEMFLDVQIISSQIEKDLWRVEVRKELGGANGMG